jgi:glyoxylase-like metal-dependent hydrolase (beta-lactamase superfamily II)
MAKLALSLKELMKLPDEARVVPGHGPQTTIGAERRSNPYVLQFGV